MSGGNGQDNPASVARRTSSSTVVLPIFTLLAMARLPRPADHLRRSTSLIFRMGVLSLGILISFDKNKEQHTLFSGSLPSVSYR